MTTPAANTKINWPKVARISLRFSWWVVVFAAKLLMLIFALFQEILRLGSKQEDEDTETAHSKIMKDHLMRLRNGTD